MRLEVAAERQLAVVARQLAVESWRVVVTLAAAEILLAVGKGRLAVGKRRLAVECQLTEVGMLLASGKRLSVLELGVAAEEEDWARPSAGTELQQVSS